MNNINFQGRSDIVFNVKDFEKALHSSRSVKSGTKSVLACQKPYLFDVNADDVVVIAKSDKNGFAKYIPLSKHSEKMLDELANTFEALVEKSKNSVTAWIIGGDRFEGRSGNATTSLINKLADIFCDRPNVDTSLLVGSNIPEEKVIFNFNKDKTNVIFNRPQNTDLEEAFDIVELNNASVI